MGSETKLTSIQNGQQNQHVKEAPPNQTASSACSRVSSGVPTEIMD